MAGNTRKSSAAVRDELLEATSSVLERVGHEALTVRAVASEAQVSVVSIYNHYTDKEGLLAAIVARQFERLNGIVRVLSDMGSRLDARTLLQQAVIEYRTFALSAPEAYKLMFARRLNELSIALAAFEAFASLVAHGQEAGAFTTAHDARSIAKVLWSACHGNALLEINGINLDSVPSSVTDIADFVIDGVAI
jgi:AcrR family transcriptional regulator